MNELMELSKWISERMEAIEIGMRGKSHCEYEGGKYDSLADVLDKIEELAKRD